MRRRLRALQTGYSVPREQWSAPEPVRVFATPVVGRILDKVTLTCKLVLRAENPTIEVASQSSKLQHERGARSMAVDRSGAWFSSGLWTKDDTWKESHILQLGDRFELSCSTTRDVCFEWLRNGRMVCIVSL